MGRWPGRMTNRIAGDLGIPVGGDIKTLVDLCESVMKVAAALELANAIISQTMKDHNIYPAVGNKVYIEEALSDALRLGLVEKAER
jgi:hypothetical protein